MHKVYCDLCGKQKKMETELQGKNIPITPKVSIFAEFKLTQDSTICNYCRKKYLAAVEIFIDKIKEEFENDGTKKNNAKKCPTCETPLGDVWICREGILYCSKECYDAGCNEKEKDRVCGAVAAEHK